jgi:hypothetical protein
METVKNLKMSDYSLEGEVWFPLKNEYIGLHIDDFREINHQHLNLIESLNFNEDLKSKIESAFFLACESFKHAVGLIEPLLESKSDIWKYINFYGMKIDETSIAQEDTYLVLEASGKWKDGHSYELVIKNGNELCYLGSFLYYPANSYGDISTNDGNYALKST